MGQIVPKGASTPHENHQSSFSLRKSFRRRLSRVLSTDSSISHTFNISSITENNIDLININTATEEILMTLPGVTRKLAQSIINHRQIIGRFRKIDDIALVPGMGAERLNKIRSDICVRKTVSNTSSRTQSLDSIGSFESTHTQINVNIATVFQLQGVHGLNQELAANIVEYRHKKGYFKTLDDLIKVKGINKIRLGSIKSQLTLDTVSDNGCEIKVCKNFENLLNHESGLKINFSKNLSVNGAILNGLKINSTFNDKTSNYKTNGHRKSLSMSGKNSTIPINRFSLNSVNDVFELLSVCSNRPFIEEEFQYTRNNKSVIRIASWNLHEFNCEKANNPGVREVICRTILENRLSIIGFQDIIDEESLKIVCNDLNVPRLRRITEWKDNSKKWEYCIIRGVAESKNFGFIYDSNNKNIYIKVKERSNILNDCIESKVLFNFGYIDFIINDLNVSILNIQILHSNLDFNKSLLCEKVNEVFNLNKNLILVGDFFSSEHIKGLEKYKPVINPDISTLIEIDGSTLVKSGACSILISEIDNKYFVGISGIIQNGLCHLAIPLGWNWGGPLSPHYPIWAEFYID